jgi:hypothetical protein
LITKEKGRRRSREKGWTYPTNIGNRGAKRISLLAINGKALYPRYVIYVYCIAAMRNKVLYISSTPSFSLSPLYITRETERQIDLLSNK